MKVDYINHMGDDLTVVNAARVSFDKESEWFMGNPPDYGMAGVLNPKDEKLISYLAKNKHWTPFSHCMITVRETVPIFVARQRMRHTVGFTYNEVSRRYVDDEPEFFKPIWRQKAENIKQGSAGQIKDYKLTHYFDETYNEVLQVCEDAYTNLIDIGVAPEQARMVLPLSTYTSYYCTGSLAAFSRAYLLRSEPHAQKEIQDLASMWNDIIKPLYPVSWNALTNV